MTTPASTSTAGPERGPSVHRRRAASGSVLALVAVLAVVITACSSAGDGAGTGSVGSIPAQVDDGAVVRFPEGTTIRVVTHDSFAVSEDVLQSFTEESGVEVELLPSGDAVTAVNRAILTADNPEGDLLFGIDENLLSAAFDAELFTPYEAQGLDAVPEQYQVDPQHRVTPIDHGDVCVNYDRSWFTERSLPVPETFDDLTAPELDGTLVVEDPTSSTPGLAFLLATIAARGDGGDGASDPAWLGYWQQLADNGVKVVDGWETAYNIDFSGSAGQGDRPLVVSYASSPPFEVTDPSTPPDQAPTGVVAETCYRQTEFAGVLRGAEEPDAAAAFVEFMLTVPFQEDVPEQMYVFPVNRDAQLPETWERYTTPVPDPLAIPYEEVGAQRDAWVQQWSELFR